MDVKRSQSMPLFGFSGKSNKSSPGFFSGSHVHGNDLSCTDKVTYYVNKPNLETLIIEAYTPETINSLLQLNNEQKNSNNLLFTQYISSELHIKGRERQVYNFLLSLEDIYLSSAEHFCHKIIEYMHYSNIPDTELLIPFTKEITITIASTDTKKPVENDFTWIYADTHLIDRECSPSGKLHQLVTDSDLKISLKIKTVNLEIQGSQETLHTIEEKFYRLLKFNPTQLFKMIDNPKLSKHKLSKSNENTTVSPKKTNIPQSKSF